MSLHLHSSYIILVFVYAGAVAPEYIELRVTNSQGDTQPLNLTTVTATELRVELPDGSRTVWDAPVTEQSSTALKVKRTFAVGDVDQVGTYKLQLYMTVPTGTRRSAPTTINVVTSL